MHSGTLADPHAQELPCAEPRQPKSRFSKEPAARLTHHLDVGVLSQGTVTGHGLMGEREGCSVGGVEGTAPEQRPCGAALTGRGSSWGAPFCTGSVASSRSGLRFLDFLSFPRSSFSFLCFFFFCVDFWEQVSRGQGTVCRVSRGQTDKGCSRQHQAGLGTVHTDPCYNTQWPRAAEMECDKADTDKAVAGTA